MQNPDKDMLEPLEQIIGYQFRDRQLLKQSLTHRSYSNEANGGGPDNQRLEFFGDAILEFLVSRELFLHFPESREGELTRMRATLVDEENLARLAVLSGLGEFLRLGKGEERSGGREKKSLLADAYEALVAAVYLDGGLKPAQRLVGRHFAPFRRGHNAVLLSRDYKTELQERGQACFATTPCYEVREMTGPDHARLFRVEVLLNGALAGEGSGRSKKEAQQAAARDALARLAQ